MSVAKVVHLERSLQSYLRAPVVWKRLQRSSAVGVHPAEGRFDEGRFPALRELSNRY